MHYYRNRTDDDDGPKDVACIENVNSKNRPTQVASAYNNLMNYQWLDALLELTVYPENTRFEKLIEIMTVRPFTISLEKNLTRNRFPFAIISFDSRK